MHNGPSWSAAHGRSPQCGTRSSRIQQHLGPSWSVRHLAAPRSVGPAVSTNTTPPIRSQTSELRECILLLSLPVSQSLLNVSGHVLVSVTLL